MVTAYSPHGETGGTLHFPSPSHIRHIDSASTFKQLRRSLSRSPSKGAATFRLVTSKSASPSPSSPLSPSRNCVATRSVSTGYLPNSNATISSPLGTPYCPGVRKTRSNIRRLSPMGVASRSKSSQRSPGRSILSDLSNHGNVTPQSSGEIGDEIENRREQSTSPDGGPAPQLASKPLGAGFKENQIPSRAIARLENSIRIAGASAKSSPLKRSDGIMNLDQANLGSPSAKRRSLHAANLVLDFDIFDHEAASQAFREGRGMISEPTTGDSTSEQLLMVSPLPRRPPSLRRTTLQQRHDKPNLTRSKPHVDLAHDLATPGQSTSKNRFRMSLDNFLPSMPRDSPFSSQGSLPNASAHLMSQPNAKPSTLNWQDRPQRHPLSRTITQSSNSSMAEESPSHIPVRHPEPRKPLVDFSKSLPVGAARPTSREALISNPSSQTAGTEASFSTPENYRLARPLPAAFMSTGLISKRHKDMEDSQAGFQGGRSMMPDTPCKRQSIAVVSNPTVTPDVAAGRASHVRHSFGTPSTPFSPHSSRPAPGVLGKSVSIFGSTFNSGSVNRRGSFLGIEANDHSHSLGKLDSQSSNESDLPPTPTKQITSTSEAWNYSADKSFLHRDVSQPSFGLSADSPDSKSHGTENCKLLSVGTPEVKVDGNSDGNAELSPIAVLGFRNFSALSLSFTRSRSLRDFRTPTPLVQKSNIVQSPHFNDSRTKSSPLSPASSGRERCEQLSPHTPRESMIPPDPSGLSISGHADRHFMGPSDLPSSVSVPPPATPTASRDYSTSFGNGRLSLHVSHDVADVDPSLTSRFEKADLIGTGEFSHVYRVTKFQGFKSLPGCFSLPTARGSSQTPMPVLVWAVKKSRHAFIGPKDRQRKLQEVSTLRALGHSDHTVQFFDSWEERSHLYIQTEFCEEGSLDLFLDRVGRKARLDDFRIWKIMLELSLGLKHVHDSGFIHLDLKPANVLITFEGVLKISDFGMATQWPAPPGIEGEGDREYIGPEILLGRFDKPSDIFALGLIMLEIAGNVMLPDNGTSWQRLRSGDMSDVPSLTWSSETSTIFRDVAGKPVSSGGLADDFDESDSAEDDMGASSFLRRPREGEKKRPLRKYQFLRTGELTQPPDFMVDANHAEALDRVVRWMISPESANRPVVDEILRTRGVSWAEARRRAGATIYEGNWGPADEILAADAEMIDV